MNTITRGAASRPIVSLFFVALLTGCAVVPYDAGYPAYSAYPAYGSYPYGPYGPDMYGYGVAPAYGTPIYGGPTLEFGFGIHDEGRHWHHRGHHRDGRWNGDRRSR